MAAADWILPLASVAVVNFLGAMSPGPATVMLVRVSATEGRRAGLAATLGLTVGAPCWAAAALFGLQALFEHLPWLYGVMRIVGAAYLLFLAGMMWRAAPTPMPRFDAVDTRSRRNVFLQALLLQLSNPKIMLFFASVYVAVLPPAMPWSVELFLLALAILVEFVWSGTVTLFFSSVTARAVYARAKPWIERVMAMVMLTIALRLVFV
jgi:threonine/homoserine/homoserine lactone efflux protein